MADPDPDYGKDSRDNYELQHPTEEKEHPEYDKAYLDGERQPNPGGGLTPAQVDALRKKLAEKASRYSRPAGGFVNGDPRKGPNEGPPPANVDLDPSTEQVEGGGVHVKPGQPQRTDKQICDSVYHWVEDMFWPKQAEPTGTDRTRLDRNWGKSDAIDKGQLDVGKRVPKDAKSAWYCGEQAQFLAWLLRQLGYKVQYKNIIPSEPKSNPPFDIVVSQQTAALDVWYGGAWHLYDPFESFSDADGGLSAYVNKKGDCAAPYSDAYVYRWERGDYDHFTWDAPKDPETESYLDNHMQNEGWTRHDYVPKRAGISLRNTRADIRLGLRTEHAFCGWFGEGDIRETWIGARYRPYGRPISRAMGSRDWTPATDERVDVNLFSEGSLELALIVRNIGDDTSDFEIEVTMCEDGYLSVQLDPPAIAGRIAPGETQSFELPLRVERIDWPPPSPVIGVRGCAHNGRVYLTWNEVPGAAGYRVYRRASEILRDADLASATLVREVPLECIEMPWRGSQPRFFAVTAVDERGRASSLDPEEGSSTVIPPPPQERTSRRRPGRPSAPARRKG